MKATAIDANLFGLAGLGWRGEAIPRLNAHVAKLPAI